MWRKEVQKRKVITIVLFLLFLMPKPVLGLTVEMENDGRFDMKRRGVSVDSMKRDTVPASVVIKSPSDHSKLFSRPKIMSFKYTGGQVLKSNKSVRGENPVPYAQYAEAKYGYSVLGNRWKDIAYGMPYYGIGVGVYGFNRNDLGHPISAYLYQGALLYEFSPTLQLKYEWNLGASFNWETYDPVTNPRNECVSAPANVYFAANLYLNWVMSQYWDFNAGLSINHVSNGATRLPNSGLNTVGAFVGVTYNFDRERVMREYNPFLTVPQFRQRFISDITVHGTVRQRTYPGSLSGLSSDYIDHNFMVMGVSYALLHMPGYKYRYGIGVDGIYDESADFTAHKIGEKENGDDIMHIHYGKTRNRFALGLSLRGEMVLPKYIVSAQAGYDIINNNKYDERFYQSITVKVPFWQGMYGSFSIRSKELSKAQYLLFGMGYAIEHKPFKNKK